MTVFFVGGSPRAGTTLLQSILCSDERTNPLIREVRYLFKIIGTYQYCSATFETLESRHYFSSAEEVREFTGEWAEAFLSRLRARYAPADRLVLKHVGMTQMFPALAALLPEARLLLIVRDPKDTIGSLIEVGRKMVGQGKQNRFPPVVDQLAEFYKSFYLPSLSCHEPDFRARLLVVRYEDLVRDPPAQIARLEDFTGLSLAGFDPIGRWSRHKVDFEQDREGGNPWITELYGDSVSDSRLGRYRDVMSESQAATIERACAEVMAATGYAPTADQAAV
jgi:hypothetical protein